MKIKRRLRKIFVAAAILGGVVNNAGALTIIDNGTTLGASTTLEICSVPNTANWRYSGLVSVWNSGAVDTVGFKIDDFIQYQNTSSPSFTNMFPQALQQAGREIPAGTTVETAVTFPYSIDAPALQGTIQNIALVKILNYSGAVGTLTGPEPKSTFVGIVLPCTAATGCTLTQGYWKTHPEWPRGTSPGSMFFLSGLTWQQVLDTSVAKGNAYFNLAHQYIAAALNQASGAVAPKGVQAVLVAANDYFLTATTSCPSGICGSQITWAKTLDDFNSGVYPGGPPHCP